MTPSRLDRSGALQLMLLKVGEDLDRAVNWPRIMWLAAATDRATAEGCFRAAFGLPSEPTSPGELAELLDEPFRKLREIERAVDAWHRGFAFQKEDGDHDHLERAADFLEYIRTVLGSEVVE